jgi:16S rRNA (cytosine1407-C5)-methyltransferase
MSNDTIDNTEYTILDMSASPGWKTTQLSEYYPNATIIANELDKTRLKGLFSNIDRMWGENIYVTNYDGRFFKQIPETFDKVLLDAPCSGEGTAFKTDDALKHWNIKNIKRIAKLQFGLLEAAGKTIKVWGEIIYSTCTLNTMENEEVLEKFLKKYEWKFEISSLWENTYIRNWPHTNNTGGFFVAKITKVSSLEWNQDIKHVRQNYEKLSSNDMKMIQNFYMDTFTIDISSKYLYTYRWEIYMSSKSIYDLWEQLFFYQIGRKIGTLDNGEFIPNFYGSPKTIKKNWIIELSKKEIHTLYTGYELETKKLDGYYQAVSESISGWIVKIKEGKIKSLLDTGKMRK